MIIECSNNQNSLRSNPSCNPTTDFRYARNQASILLHPNNGGRKLFGYSDADLTTGMIQMSRRGLTSRTVDRLQIICNHPKRLSSTSPGSRHNPTGDGGQRGGGGGLSGSGGAAGGGEDRQGLTGGPVAGARQGVQTAPGGSGAGSGLAKNGRNAPGGLANPDDEDGREGAEEARGGGGWEGGESGGQHDNSTGDNDHSQILKIKAAQALFRMSLEHGGEASCTASWTVVDRPAGWYVTFKNPTRTVASRVWLFSGRFKISQECPSRSAESLPHCGCPKATVDEVKDRRQALVGVCLLACDDKVY